MLGPFRDPDGDVVTVEPAANVEAAAATLTGFGDE